jgi:putative hydrolase of the HAD superfamily
MKIEAFIFDIGNVLAHFDFGRAEAALERLGCPVRDWSAVEPLARRYETGQIGRDEFLAGVNALLGRPAPPEALARAWQDIFTPNLPMWEVVENLHGTYPLYLLSNTNCLHLEHVTAEYGVFARFDDGVYSHVAGAMKPDPRIFARAIRQFGVRPEATVYVDDLAPNVAAARDAGLRALPYRADRHAEFLAALRGLGVQCV